MKPPTFSVEKKGLELKALTVLMHALLHVGCRRERMVAEEATHTRPEHNTPHRISLIYFESTVRELKWRGEDQ